MVPLPTLPRVPYGATCGGCRWFVKRYMRAERPGQSPVMFGQCSYSPLAQRTDRIYDTGEQPACHAWEAMPDEPGPEHWWKEKR